MTRARCSRTRSASPQSNRSRLYDKVFDLLLSGKHKPEPQPMEHEAAVREVVVAILPTNLAGREA